MDDSLNDHLDARAATSGAPPGLPPIDGRAAFARAVELALTRAADEGVRELSLVDPDFIDWPLADAAVLGALTRWAGPKRRLLMLAHGFEPLAAQPRLARFVAWRRQWSHLIECRAAPGLARSELPSLLLAGPHASLQRLDPASSRGRWLVQQEEIETWREVIDAILQRSEVAFPAHTLGL